MLQVLFNGLISASIYILVGLGFSLIYRTTRFFNFAHGIVLTCGAYFAFMFKVCLNIPLLLSCLFAVVLCLLLGYIVDIFIYHQLRQKRAGPLIHLLASLGIYVILLNLISILFGDRILSIRSSKIVEGHSFLGARVTSIQIITIFISGSLIIVTIFLLRKTKIGKALRAVANDATLASISGINSDQVIRFSLTIGSALAGVAGILMALDVDMTPTMGMNVLMMGIVAVIVGGIDSIPGIVLGAFLLGMAQHFGAWFIGSQWQDAIAFLILVLFLLFKPEGFFGKKVESATV